MAVATDREAWPPWRLWEALGAIAVLAVTQLLLALAVGAFFGFFGPDSPAHRIAISLPILVLGSHAAAWGMVAWILARRHAGFRSALRIAEPPSRRLLKACGAGLGLYLLVLPLLAVFPPAREQTNPFTEIFRKGGPGLAMLAVTAIVLAPPLEEALFRGLLLPVLRKRWEFWPAATVVTAVFTALHMTQTSLYWPALAGIFACGLVLAWLRERTASLWPSIAFHVGFNTTPFLIWLVAQPFGGLPDGPLS